MLQAREQYRQKAAQTGGARPRCLVADAPWVSLTSAAPTPVNSSGAVLLRTYGLVRQVCAPLCNLPVFSCAQPTAKPRLVRCRNQRRLAQNRAEILPCLLPVTWKVLTRSGATLQNKGTAGCKPGNQLQYWGYAPVWRPVARPLANRWFLGPAQGRSARRLSVAAWSPEQPSAPLPISSIARKTRGSADAATHLADLTQRPQQGQSRNCATPRIAPGLRVAFCVPTSRRQRTANV